MAEFTWVPFYKELAQKLIPFQNRQTELIDLLDSILKKGIPSISVTDKDENGNRPRLNEIDPFTFFASFNRGTKNENRVKILQETKGYFNIQCDVPEDFMGIPVVDNRKSWFFAYKSGRGKDDIKWLWELFHKAVLSPQQITNHVFDRVLTIKNVSITNLSMGLYWVNPDHFTNCDGRMHEYLTTHGYNFAKIKNWKDYQAHRESLKSFIPDLTYYQISFEAWKETTKVEEPEIHYTDSKGKIKKDVKYWLFAPGHGADMWDEFFDNEIMALGWDELGNLKQYKTRGEIRDKLIGAYGGKGSKKNDVSANDDFINKVKIGDIIIAKKGRGELLGYGIVDSDYYFDENRDDFKSCRKVDWKIKGIWKVDHNLVLKTLTDITKYASEHTEYEKYYERLMATINGEYKPIINIKEHQICYPLNQILFGPPGTGKTYNSINHALAIIEEKELEELETESEENRVEVLRRYKAFVDSGQIVFTTFHQSMCYEDFIEGIKPVELDYQLSYELKKGIFKTIAENARNNYRNYKKQSVKISFEEAWNSFLEPLVEGETVNVQMKKSAYEITHVTDKTIFFDKESGDSKHSLSVNTLKAMYNDGENNLIKGGLQPYYEPLLNELLQRSEVSKKENLKNYVLIIDEINRGNIAQIFGELITLIEKDKRLGAKEELTVTLPYSKQKDFGVPSNLYIVGTMNTADRSVEALDTALRRRFSFVEMPPNYELSQLENEVAGHSLIEILETINGRIEKLLNKDHLIGHSYFLSVEDLDGLQNVFQHNLIPLLQEYFYGDMAKIGLVLGEAFFEKQQNGDNIKFAKFKHDAIDDLEERHVIRLKQYWKPGEFEQAIQELVNPS